MVKRRNTVDEALLCVGVVSGARGLGGELRVKSFTADPADVAAYGALVDEAGADPLCLRVVGRHGGTVIARVDGVNDRTAADALKGRHLYVRRDVLPDAGEDEYYHVDLVGLSAETAAGDLLGTVRAVFDFGAGDVLDIVAADGRPLVVPFTRRAVPEVDIAGGRLVVDPPAGLLDDAEPDTADAGEVRR